MVEHPPAHPVHSSSTCSAPTGTQNLTIQVLTPEEAPNQTLWGEAVGAAAPSRVPLTGGDRQHPEANCPGRSPPTLGRGCGPLKAKDTSGEASHGHIAPHVCSLMSAAGISSSAALGDAVTTAHTSLQSHHSFTQEGRGGSPSPRAIWAMVQASSILL
jgi:hypothetical protein